MLEILTSAQVDRARDTGRLVGNILQSGHYVCTAVNDAVLHGMPHDYALADGDLLRGYKLRTGLLLALEPWIMADTDRLVVDADGWTLRSATGGRTAHSEHTIAITDDGAEILTLPSEHIP